MESALYTHFLKYEVMDGLEKEFEVPEMEGIDFINIFLDIHTMLESLYNFEEYTDAVEIISSCIINMAAHYKNYFWNRYRVRSQVILVYATGTSSNILRFVPEYNSKIRNLKAKNDEMDQRICVALERVKLIVPYIPEVYFQEINVEFAVVVKNMLMHPKFSKIPSVVISNSNYTYTLPYACKDESYCVVFRRFRNKEEKFTGAYAYNQHNATNAFIQETKQIYITDVQVPEIMLLPLMILTGIKGKSVKQLLSFKKALKYLYNTPLEVMEDINELFISIASQYERKRYLEKCSFDVFYNRFMGLSINLQLASYMETPQSNNWEFLEEFSDPDNIRYINGQYFKKYPLQFSYV